MIIIPFMLNHYIIKMSKKNDGGSTIPTEDDEPISKVSINKYDPFQLKGSIDDEIVYVSAIKNDNLL